MRFVVCAVGLLACWVAMSANVPFADAQDDGRRAVNVKRYGISVRVPQAWRLIAWGQDDQAFSLKLPQDGGSKSGFVSCRVGSAPESLEDYRKRFEAERVDSDGAKRSLVENKLEPVDAERFGTTLAQQLGQALVTTWEVRGADETLGFEVAMRVVHDGTLYTFTLASDESHWDAYRLDFDDMLASAVFTPPELAVRQMPGGYWMQSDFRFAMRLPPEWKPSFGPNDKVLFFATGRTHELFTDNLLVLASPPRPLDFEQLRTSLAEQITKMDSQATVVCELVPQGGSTALETIVRTVRGTTKIAILERRFTSGQRNYEVKFTCEAEEFEKQLPELRRSLDSFIEVQQEPVRHDV